MVNMTSEQNDSRADDFSENVNVVSSNSSIVTSAESTDTEFLNLESPTFVKDLFEAYERLQKCRTIHSIPGSGMRVRFMYHDNDNGETTQNSGLSLPRRLDLSESGVKGGQNNCSLPVVDGLSSIAASSDEALEFITETEMSNGATTFNEAISQFDNESERQVERVNVNTSKDQQLGCVIRGVVKFFEGEGDEALGPEKGAALAAIIRDLLENEAKLQEEKIQRPAPGLSLTDLSCAVCYELLIDPTTLSCGHSFCRICLASWRLSSDKAECLECRQPWYGLPKVNLLMRQMIQASCPEEYKKRSAQLSADPATGATISKFETVVSSSPEGGGRQRRRVGATVAAAVSLGFVLSLSLYIFGYLEPPPTDLTQPFWSRPLRHWSREDVSQWLAEIRALHGLHRPGKAYHPLTLDDLTGKQLAELQLDTLPHYSDDPARVLRLELAAVQRLDGVVPRNVLQYRERDLPRAIRWQFALRVFPRLAFLYAYIAEYERVFLPLTHTIEPPDDAIAELPNIHAIELPDPTPWQLYWMSSYMGMPYEAIGRVMWMTTQPTWLAMLLVMHCAAAMVTELLWFCAAAVEWRREAHALWGHAWWQVWVEPLVLPPRARQIEFRKMVTRAGCMFAALNVALAILPTFMLRVWFDAMLYIVPVFSIGQVIMALRRLFARRVHND